MKKPLKRGAKKTKSIKRGLKVEAEPKIRDKSVVISRNDLVLMIASLGLTIDALTDMRVYLSNF